MRENYNVNSYCYGAGEVCLKKIRQCFFVQSEIKKILDLPKEEREIKLRSLAQDLGCNLDSTYLENGRHLTEEVIRRIREAARTYRESCLWLIAILSALASVASALAAWYAVLLKK